MDIPVCSSLQIRPNQRNSTWMFPSVISYTLGELSEFLPVFWELMKHSVVSFIDLKRWTVCNHCQARVWNLRIAATLCWSISHRSLWLPSLTLAGTSRKAHYTHKIWGIHMPFIWLLGTSSNFLPIPWESFSAFPSLSFCACTTDLAKLHSNAKYSTILVTKIKDICYM